MPGTWGTSFGSAWGSSWGALLTTVVELVESPTRLGKMRRTMKTGDTLVITDTLMGYNREAQDLPAGSTAVLNLTTPDGTLLVERKPVTILQSGSGDTATKKGRVTVTVPASTNIPEGVNTFEIETTTPDGRVLTFPDDVNAELVVIKQLG